MGSSIDTYGVATYIGLYCTYCRLRTHWRQLLPTKISAVMTWKSYKSPYGILKRTSTIP